MAAHNQIRVLGYLLDNPQIENEGEPGEEKVYLTIRVRNRAVDGYPSSDFQDLIIFYDGANEYRNRDKIMDKLKSLIKYDLIDVKGVSLLWRTEYQNFRCIVFYLSNFCY